MSLDCGWIEEIMEEHAPRCLAMEYDNVGLLVGDRKVQLKTVLIALDLTDLVLDEAVLSGAQLIVTHHPLIFKPVKRITSETALGRRLIRLIKEDIALYAAHTNLDAAAGGTNDILFDLLGLTDKEPDGLESGIGRVGHLGTETTLGELADLVKRRLNLPGVNVTGSLERRIRKVGLCSGSGAEFIMAAAARGCDVYITGDIKYHEAQMAEEMGLCLIDATHFATEVIVAESLREYIERRALERGERIKVLASKADASAMRLY